MPYYEPTVSGRFFADFGSDMEMIPALNEIIANSIDSWIEEGCEKSSQRPQLVIDIEVGKKHISITDNAEGMDESRIKELVSLAEREKEESPCADQLMGKFGAGMKAAAASIGSHYEVITKMKKKDVVHACVPLDKMRDDPEKNKPHYQKGFNKKHTKLEEEIDTHNLGKNSSGTTLYITNLKNEDINAASLLIPLGECWRFFIKGKHHKNIKEKFGKWIEINVIDVQQGKTKKVKDQDLGQEGMGMIPFTDVKFSKEITYTDKDIDGNEIEKKTNVEGKIWVNFSGGQEEAGGITTYRRGQCIELREQKKGRQQRTVGQWWSNAKARIEGYVECNDFIVNNRKNGMDYTHEVNKAVADYIKAFIPHTLVTSGQGFKEADILGDKEKLNKWIATKWLPGFGENDITIELPEELKKYLPRSARPGGGTGGGGGSSPSPDPAPEDDGDDEEIFVPIDEKRFVLDNKEYSIEIIEDKCGGKMFDWNPTENRIIVSIDPDFDKEHEKLTKLLKDIVKDRGSSDHKDLSRALIVQSVLQEFLQVEMGSNEAFQYSQQWVQNFYKGI